MESTSSTWRIVAADASATPPSPSGDPLAPPPPPPSSPGHSARATAATGGYKPSLTVDVAAAEKEASPHSALAFNPTRTPHVATNIFVAGLPTAWDDNDLQAHYKSFGEIVSTKVVKSKHFGFVMFRTPEAAHRAINATHLTRPTTSCPTLLHVSIAMHDEGVDGEPNSRIFVRGLPQWATKEHLRQCFCRFGSVAECAVLMNPLGQCKGSGFVQFGTVDEASAAVHAQERVRIDSWDFPLEVKFSEPIEVRQLRQERNRNRQRIYAASPKYRGSSIGSGGQSPGASLPPPFDTATALNLNSPPFPFFSAPLPVLPSPQQYPMLSPMPFPMVYTPQQPPQLVSTPQPSLSAAGVNLRPVNPSTPSAAERPTQIIYPQPVMAPLYDASGTLVAGPPPMPLKGDLHFSGKPVTEDLLRLLLQPYGTVAVMKTLSSDEGGGVAVRMSDVSKHTEVARHLNGTIFPTGDLLAAGLYA